MRPATHLVMLGTAFDTRGGITSVVRAYRAEGLFERWPIDYVATHCDGGAARKLLTAAAALCRFVALLAAHRRVVLHLHCSSRASFWRKSVFMAIGLLARCPVILHLHSGGFARFYAVECGALRRRLIRYFFDRAACVLVVSESWRAWVGSMTTNAGVICLPNPVQPVLEQGAAQRRPVVLFLGRIEAQKGIHELLDAVAALRASIPDLELICAGAGEVEAAARQAARLGIAHAVHFPGWVGAAEKQALLDRAAVFALPSHAEGLPMSLLEAMAAGVPAVATAVGGIPDLLQDGVNGLLVAPGDAAALQRALQRLLGDPQLRAALGQAARDTVRRRYSADRVVAQLEAVYAGLGLARANEGERLPLRKAA